MKSGEAKRTQKALGLAFKVFYPLESKKLNKKNSFTHEAVELVSIDSLNLLSVHEGKQTATVALLRHITGWKVKDTTDFVKEGEFPKKIIFDIKDLEVPVEELKALIEKAEQDEICVIELETN
mgnify:CR=1 FL=1